MSQLLEINSNEPLEDQYRRAAHRWNDLKSAADLLEETRSAVLAQRMSKLGEDMAVNKAERIVKASPEWMDYNKRMVEARQKANAAEIDKEWLRMKYWSQSSDRADERVIARM